MRDAAPTTSVTRERIMDTAAHLMSHRGIRDVTFQDVAEASGVPVSVLQRHFPTKDSLALAFLRHREETWTMGVVDAGARMRGATPTAQLLAIFDVFHDWFQRDDFEACSFINVLLEMGKEHPLGIASRDYLANIRDVVQTLAVEAGLERTEAFAQSWHILMKGSIISAVEGDVDAARRAQNMARDLIARHTRPYLEEDYDLDLEAWNGRKRPTGGEAQRPIHFHPADTYLEYLDDLES